jgi:hypothetical protein
VSAFAAYRFKKTDDDDWMPAVIIFSIISLLTFMPGMWAWIDPWTWTTINHPELWIAKKSLNL